MRISVNGLELPAFNIVTFNVHFITGVDIYQRHKYNTEYFSSNKFAGNECPEIMIFFRQIMINFD